MFRSFRENVRLSLGNILLVGLNVPGDNNHYRNEGGRNGEFEDRREANRQWLARAFSLAQQHGMSGIIIVAHGDPQFGNGWEKRGKPTLLDGFMRVVRATATWNSSASYASCPAAIAGRYCSCIRAAMAITPTSRCAMRPASRCRISRAWHCRAARRHNGPS